MPILSDLIVIIKKEALNSHLFDSFERPNRSLKNHVLNSYLFDFKIGTIMLYLDFNQTGVCRDCLFLT
jgi:hypothetical protein